MAMLRRMLKFAPVILMGMLLLIWGLSLRGLVSHTFHSGRYALTVSAYNGSGGYWLLTGDYLAENRPVANGVEGEPMPIPEIGAHSLFGHFEMINADMGWVRSWNGQMPLLVVVTLLLPLMIGALTGFRFRLWQYLAYTAVVAVQLAHYVRWSQE